MTCHLRRILTPERAPWFFSGRQLLGGSPRQRAGRQRECLLQSKQNGESWLAMTVFQERNKDRIDASAFGEDLLCNFRPRTRLLQS